MTKSRRTPLRPEETTLIRALSAVRVESQISDNFNLDAKVYAKLIHRKDSTLWEKAGERKALKLFHKAAEAVPAYKDFLKKNRVRADTVRTVDDLAKVPFTTKENYIKRYTLADRSWGGSMRGHNILAVSSGTSGKPTMWPRGSEQEREALLTHKFLLTELYEIDKYRTLMVIGFPMGMYVSGVATAVPSLLTAFEHPNLSIATIGYNKDATIDLVRNYGRSFEQIILVGHPFYIKDLIETGLAQHIEWKKGPRVRTFMCSEGFNEVWRSYTSGLLGVEPQTHMYNTLGSSEFLLTGYETPLSISVRQSAENNPEIATSLFGSDVVPNLFQYNPLLRYIQTSEEDGAKGDLCITADAGIPLIRFNQHDYGQLMKYQDVVETYFKSGLGIIDKKVWHLPFVSFYGRSDRTLKFYAANIYPEHIMAALDTPGLLPKVTGKFVMDKKPLPNKDQYLEIHVEMKQEARSSMSLVKTLQNTIVVTLEHLNKEYLFLRQNLGKDMVPRIILHELGAAPHFHKPGKPQFIMPHHKDSISRKH